MKNWINKHILLLGILLLVCYNQAAAHSNSLSYHSGKEVSFSEGQKHLASINSISSPVLKKSESKYTTSEVDEEEINTSAKKFLKGTASIISTFTGHNVSGHFAAVYQKRLSNKQLLSFSPYRLYIKFRVIRL